MYKTNGSQLYFETSFHLTFFIAHPFGFLLSRFEDPHLF
jgi:hypothetical protein